MEHQPLNFRYFYEISQIPRPSFHEEKIADYVERFAKEHGYRCTRDRLHNLIVKRPASPGREGEEPLILQAHMDMICAKEAWSQHDFSKDPIQIREEDGWLKANGTTLGADDGAGVANMLGILAEPELSNPPLECIFTVQEENGMGGAKEIDLSSVRGRRIIGLDGIEGGTTIYSSSGVWGCSLKTELRPQSDVRGLTPFRLKISALTSGHGALLIGEQRANAIKLTARILLELAQNTPVCLSSMHGGKLFSIIPGECVTEFLAEGDRESLLAPLETQLAQIKTEYARTDPEMEISLETGSAASGCTPEDSLRLIRFLTLLPDGAQRRSSEDLTHVETSRNLAVLQLADGRAEIDYTCRANYPCSVQELRRVTETCADLLGFRCEEIRSYAGHHAPLDAPLVRLWSDIYRQDTGRPLGMVYIHSSLDLGAICEKLSITNAIVMMPTTPDVHTTRERMSADSFRDTYRYLKEVLAQT